MTKNIERSQAYKISKEDFSTTIDGMVNKFKLHDFLYSHGLKLAFNQARLDFNRIHTEIRKSKDTWMGAEFANEELFLRGNALEDAIQILGYAFGVRSLKKLQSLFVPATNKQDRLAKFQAWLFLDIFMTAAGRYSHMYDNEFWNNIERGRIDDDLFMAFYTMHCLAHDTVVEPQQPSMVEQAFHVVKSLEMTNGCSDILIQTEANFIETKDLVRKTCEYFYQKTNEGFFDEDLKVFYEAATDATGLDYENLSYQVNSVYQGKATVYSAQRINEMLGDDPHFSFE